MEKASIAISLEEEDSRIYDGFVHELDENYPDTAKVFRAMAHEESAHRHRLLYLLIVWRAQVFVQCRSVSFCLDRGDEGSSYRPAIVFQVYRK
jgi:rubrerythrin